MGTMARRTGVARKVDQLGRVVLPAEVRRHFGISPGDFIEIAVDSDAILLSKVEDRCVFCSGTADLSEFSGKLVCRVCLTRLAAENPSSA
jgi:AbrB family transcriptional regulator, transcriptional pleiotropic regulator of transition state genes